MKVLLGHLDWGLGTIGQHNDPAYKTFLGLCIVSSVSKLSNFKNVVKTSVAGSYTILRKTDVLKNSILSERKFEEMH